MPESQRLSLLISSVGFLFCGPNPRDLMPGPRDQIEMHFLHFGGAMSLQLLATSGVIDNKRCVRQRSLRQSLRPTEECPAATEGDGVCLTPPRVMGSVGPSRLRRFIAH